MSGLALTDLNVLSSINDDDIVYVVRSSTNPAQDYKASITTLKTKIKSESSTAVNISSTLPVNVDIILLNSGLSTINLILPDGINNQELLLIGRTLTSNAIITVSNFASGNTITFTLAGQTIKLKFITDKWYIISNNGTTIS